MNVKRTIAIRTWGRPAPYHYALLLTAGYKLRTTIAADYVEYRGKRSVVTISSL